MCPPPSSSLETIPPEKKPATTTADQPIPKPADDDDEPFRFDFITSPDPDNNLSPLNMDPPAAAAADDEDDDDDDDKCPTRLMKMSKIPVCDSGKRGPDMMRLPRESTYSVFNIRPCIFSVFPLSSLIVILFFFFFFFNFVLFSVLICRLCLWGACCIFA